MSLDTQDLKKVIETPQESAPEDTPLSIAAWQKKVHETAKSKGWWESPRDFGTICALFHEEVSEAFTEYRNGHALTEIYEKAGKPGKLEGVPVELADVVIRILDFCEYTGIDLEAVMLQKQAFNEGRSYRHGGRVV